MKRLVIKFALFTGLVFSSTFSIAQRDAEGRPMPLAVMQEIDSACLFKETAVITDCVLREEQSTEYMCIIPLNWDQVTFTLSPSALHVSLNVAPFSDSGNTVINDILPIYTYTGHYLNEGCWCFENSSDCILQFIEINTLYPSDLTKEKAKPKEKPIPHCNFSIGYSKSLHHPKQGLPFKPKKKREGTENSEAVNVNNEEDD